MGSTRALCFISPSRGLFSFENYALFRPVVIGPKNDFQRTRPEYPVKF